MLDLTEYGERILSANANLLYWAKELVEYPRPRKVFAVNLKYEIEQNYKTEWNNWRRPLDRFTGHMVKHHLCRNDETQSKYWLFAEFVDGEEDPLALDFPLWFLHCDLDCHLPFERHSRIQQPPELRVTEDDYLSYLADFRALREEVDSIMHHLGIEPIYYTSPGNLFTVNGQEIHVKGVHGLILLDAPVSIRRLQDYARMLQQKHGMDCEFSVLTPRTPWRLPGQIGMDVVDLLTMEPLYPTGNRLDELKGFAFEVNNRVEFMKLTPVSILEKECLDFHPVVPTAQAIPAKQTHQPPTPPKSIEDFRQEPNTFDRTVKLRRSPWKCCYAVKHGKMTEEEGIQANSQDMILCAPRNEDGSVHSQTCTNPHLLHATSSRWMRHFYKTYDPSKDRDYQDIQRFQSSADIDLEHGIRLIPGYRAKQIQTALDALMNKYNGRIAAKVIYMGKDAICSKEEWFKYRKCLPIVILAQYSVEKHDCTQYGYDPGFLKRVKDKAEVAEWAQSVHDRQQKEKKEKEYIQHGKPNTLSRSLGEPKAVDMTALGEYSDDLTAFFGESVPQ